MAFTRQRWSFSFIFLFSWKVTVECLAPIAYFFIFWFWTYYKSIMQIMHLCCYSLTFILLVTLGKDRIMLNISIDYSFNIRTLPRLQGYQCSSSNNYFIYLYKRNLWYHILLMVEFDMLLFSILRGIFW